MKVELTPKQILEFVIVGIKNENYQAVINLAQDCLDQMKVEEEKDDKQA